MEAGIGERGNGNGNSERRLGAFRCKARVRGTRFLLLPFLAPIPRSPFPNPVSEGDH